MNRKNIFIIGAFIVFIGLYQYFVLSPYQARFRQTQAQSVTAQAVTPTKTLDETNGKKKALSPTAQESLDAANTPITHDVISEIQAGHNRSIEVIEGAALGRAVLADYFVRGANVRTPIVLNNEKLVWTSSNAAVQRCFDTLNKAHVQPAANANEVVLQSDTPQGFCALRIATNDNNPGLVGMTVTLDRFKTNPGEFIELTSQGVLGSEKQADQNYVAYKMDDSIHKVHGKDLFAKTEVHGRMSWMAWGDRYFSIIVKPSGSYSPDLNYGSLPSEAGAKVSEIPVSYSFRYPAAPEDGKTRFDFSTDVYFGTRDPSALNAIAPDLVETVDLGFFASVARVMLWALKSLNTVFHNFGVSIIALTLIVRLLFWPLSKKAYTSTNRMKELQPEMERIKKKYDSTDKSQAEKMNKEVFALYKTKKVNPLGGCLPMLLQLPIFLGLYGALNHSIDLYQAPFFGWIQDLSMRDPFYILPALWTVSLLGYMQVNPQAMNTSQPGMPNMKWIMMGMNVFFGFLSKDWPSGLVLYLVVSNCVGLSQQFFLQRSNKKLQLMKEGA
ncbi:MAG: YidC/Oxa1 family insertase periplasmic-domain containing protein [Bdellovibrionota bacterium]